MTKRRTTLNRDEHQAIGATLKRMRRDLMVLHDTLYLVSSNTSRERKSIRSIERALSSLRSQLDSRAVPLWPESETQKAFAVYYGTENPSPEIAEVRRAVDDRINGIA